MYHLCPRRLQDLLVLQWSFVKCGGQVLLAFMNREKYILQGPLRTGFEHGGTGHMWNRLWSSCLSLTITVTVYWSVFLIMQLIKSVKFSCLLQLHTVGCGRRHCCLRTRKFTYNRRIFYKEKTTENDDIYHHWRFVPGDLPYRFACQRFALPAGLDWNRIDISVHLDAQNWQKCTLTVTLCSFFS